MKLEVALYDYTMALFAYNRPVIKTQTELSELRFHAEGIIGKKCGGHSLAGASGVLYLPEIGSLRRAGLK